METQTYYTRLHSQLIYKVTVVGKEVTVRTSSIASEPFSTHVFTSRCEEVLVGTSPVTPETLDSECHGPKTDGNTILLRLAPLRYRFIGWRIYDFSLDAPLVKFSSPIPINYAPTPYVRDTGGRYYLLDAEIILEPRQGEVVATGPVLTKGVLMPNYDAFPEDSEVSDPIEWKRMVADMYKSLVAGLPLEQTSGIPIIAPEKLGRIAYWVPDKDCCEIPPNTRAPRFMPLGPAFILLDPEEPIELYYTRMNKTRLRTSDIFGPDLDGSNAGDGELYSRPMGTTTPGRPIIRSIMSAVRFENRAQQLELYHPDGRTVFLTAHLYYELSEVLHRRIDARPLLCYPIHSYDMGIKVSLTAGKNRTVGAK